MKKIFYSLAVLSLIACGNPIERMCNVYDSATEDVKSASSMEELEEIRAKVAEGLDDVMFSDGDEVKELLNSKRKDYESIRKLKKSEDAFVTAVRGRVKIVYPPLSQVLDVYSNYTAKAKSASNMEELIKIVQQARKDVTLMNKDFSTELGRLSGNDKSRINKAESEFNNVVESRKKELGD